MFYFSNTFQKFVLNLEGWTTRNGKNENTFEYKLLWTSICTKELREFLQNIVKNILLPGTMTIRRPNL